MRRDPRVLGLRPWPHSFDKIGSELSRSQAAVPQFCDCRTAPEIVAWPKIGVEGGPAATEEPSGSTSDAPRPKGEGGRQATMRRSGESCQQESWTEGPKYLSRAWTPGHKYFNPAWAPKVPPPIRMTSKPLALKVADRVVQVGIQPGQSTRESRYPGAIKIYCGHAGPAAALCDAGLDGGGVDWRRNKHKTTVPILYADLTTGAGQQIMWELAQQKHVRYVPLAPPCGTYSRAREKPIPK